jgi:hypothetical protein
MRKQETIAQRWLLSPCKEYGAVMAMDVAIDRIRSELYRAFEKTRADLDRVEILAAGLAAFEEPVPSYEPWFQHLRLHPKPQELTSD